jgi:hypothetical protein
MFDWERIWLGSGILAVVLLIGTFFIYGDQPKLGASPADLVSFYDGDGTRILIATVVFCLAFLELLWFGVAVASVLRDAGMGGWGAAATASSAARSVILAFPSAMFVMSGAFGLWRAGIISNRFFSAGVAAVVLVLLGGTTWASDGFWAPDGGYSLISQIILFAWIAVLSGYLMRHTSSVRSPAPPRAIPAA